MAWTEDEDKAMKALNKEQADQVDESSRTSLQDEKKAEESVQVSSSKESDNKSTEKLWQLLESTLKENLVEKRRARRWKIFFRSLTFSVIIAIFVMAMSEADISELDVQANYVAVIPMEGQIGAGQPIDASVVLPLIDDAYAKPGIEALVLKMNSPGGSPVHSGIIYDAIQLKRKQYPDVPTYVVVEDLAASGGYYIASAADQIYADKASLVGSIGVISAGFEATELLKKIGVERRVFTAGENKAFLDPFLPMAQSSIDKWQAVLDETHGQFINAVKEGRGDRLKESSDLFTGAVFTGAQAVDLGLVDGLTSFYQLLNTEYKGVEVLYFTEDKEPWEDIVKSFGVSVANTFLDSMRLQ
jgi:protease-4